MAEHLFLCGLTKTQRAQYMAGRELRLNDPTPNLVLKVDDIRRRMLAVEPQLLTDLLELSVYVFAADCLVSRGGPALKKMGTAWRRSFRLVVAVREPGQWNEPGRLHALQEALHFLSEDDWAFEFVRLEHPPVIQDYLNFSETGADRAGDTTIVAFSGGVDSLAGAVQELIHSNRHVILMSRRLPGITGSRQSELATEIKRLFPRRITHALIRAGLTKETSALEHTQRTRSFLLSAVAIAVAYMERSDRIRFYENGIMSVNLPISTQVVGARAARSTHPRALLLLQQLAGHVLDGEVSIDNPFIWKTKAEVLREARTTDVGPLVSRTISCSNTRHLAKHSQHCGVCAQCLQRWVSELGADAAEARPDLPYALDMLLGPRQKTTDRAMAVDMVRSSLEFCRLSENDFATRFASELAWVVSGFPEFEAGEVGRRFVDLFRRQGAAVNGVFVTAAQQHAEDLLHQRLSRDSLLRIVFTDAEMKLDTSPIDSGPIEPEPHSFAFDGVERSQSSAAAIAVDRERQRILIRGIASINGATNFRILSVLVDLFREDLIAGKLPKNYRTVSAVDLANMANISEVTLRKAITRIRVRIRLDFKQLYGDEVGLDDVIENLHGRGYRINPSARLVTVGELLSP